MKFLKSIFEAIIVDVSYEKGTCTISPLSSQDAYNISGVPIPFMTGSNSSGLFLGLPKGSRVVAAETFSRGRESVVILSFLPKINLFKELYSNGTPDDAPIGYSQYPDMAENRIVIKGEFGNDFSFFEDGEARIKLADGGIYWSRYDSKLSTTFISENNFFFSKAGRGISGAVRRFPLYQRTVFPRPSTAEYALFAEPEYARYSEPMGFWTGSKPLLTNLFGKRRNPEIAEYRIVINEFSTDSMFTGFDDEVQRANNDKKLFQNSDTYKRNRETGNVLHMAEHELVEFVGGNLIDINGVPLDINYNKLVYGDDNNKTPSGDIRQDIDRAKRISRRGVGLHLQLSTNKSSSDESNSIKNFVLDLDKEGVLKLNLPASSDTGNIPFVSRSNYVKNDNQVETEFVNPSVSEKIPVMLRDKDGGVVYPKISNPEISERFTGIRFDNSDKNPYFGNSFGGIGEYVRVNTTKHHNMYATAERLIANMIDYINVPAYFTDEDGKPEELPHGKPFEVAYTEELLSPQSGKTGLPQSMSTVVVFPKNPAIDPGGDTVVCGNVFDDDESVAGRPFSNKFISSNTPDGIPIIESGNKKVGGKSANINFEGAIDLSVGSDNHDKKSIMLDTAGSLVAWFGRDRNNRSMVVQTDGDALLNVGGTYSGNVFNKGRFELRVNVTDKGFVAEEYGSDNANPKAESDYIISISEHGIVIGGMKAGTPMVLRNSGKILIESTESDVIIKGNSVKTVEPDGKAKNTKAGKR